MTVNKYIIYDQEPVHALWDFAILLIAGILPIFFIDRINIYNKTISIIGVMLYTMGILLLCNLFSKFVTSKKYEITLSISHMDIMSENKNIRIELNEILKVEQTRTGGRFTHLKIYRRDNNIIAFSNFDLHFLIRDDFERLSNDLIKIIH